MPTETPQEQKDKAREFTPSKSDLAELIQQCNDDVSKARESTQTWRNRLSDNYRRRRGLVGKPDPDFPFKNSSDLRFRSEEKKLRKVNAAFSLAITTAPKIARFVPLDPSLSMCADDLEYLLQWQMMGQDKGFVRKLKLLRNTRNHHGLCVVKIIWEQQSLPQTQVFTRSEIAEKLLPYAQKLVSATVQMGGKQSDVEFGDKELRAALADIFGWDLEDKADKRRADKAVEQWREETETVRVVVSKVISKPSLLPVEDLSLLSVPVDTGRLQEAEWIAHDIPMSERQLLQRRSKYSNVDEAIDRIAELVKSTSSQDRDLYQEAIDHAAGVTESGRIKGEVYVREMYRWVPRSYISAWSGLDDDEDTPVKAVITYCPELGNDVDPLRVMELPYDHGMWPFEEDIYNLSEDRFHNAEGLGQMLSPYSEEYDISRNAAVDRHTLTLSPPTIIWNQSKITASSFRQIGQPFYTSIPPERAIHIPQYPDLSRGFEMDASKIDADMDEVSGVPSLNAIGTYGGPPTAEQVQQTVGPYNAIQSDEMTGWTDFWARVCNHFFELDKQFLFPLIDQGKGLDVPKMTGGGFVNITPKHFSGDYFIMCGADVNRTNPMFETQKLVAWYQQMKADPSNAPFVKWFDVFYLLTVRMIGHIDAQTVLQPREQAEQLNQQFVQSVAQMKAQMEIQQEKAMQRGAKPRGQKGTGGPMTEMAGSYTGIFPKSTGQG